MASHAMLSLVDNASVDCRRQSERCRVFLTAKLVTTTDERPIKLRDLSETGALVEGEKVPEQGTDVVLMRGEFEVFARIAWSDGKRAGVQFDAPVPTGEIFAQVKAAPKAPTPAAASFRRPSLKGERLTDEEWAAAKEWAVPTGRQALRG
jgi:hypothetical protein